ncbi:MAG: Xylose isomerase-like TIM barrel [Lentisphaerae bacterium ADurb.Bin242]|nr:MAG: Xylose isomerase-like TIM barrel [Lentisphaerae bacterium ADurb.Bin242]
MLKPLSVQLYSLRERAQKDFIAVLKDVAKMGYKGVEPAGFWNLRPSTLRKVLADLGLEMYSSHSPWARINNLGEAMDIADMIGLKKIVCGYGPDDFKDLDSIKRTADQVNTMQEFLERNGYTLFQHNHAFEFERLDGRLKYEIYAELCPKVKFQIDAYWSTNFGQENAVENIKKFAGRTILIHMKDGILHQKKAEQKMVNGILDRKIELVPLGTGDMDIKGVIAAMPDTVEAVIVELDYCNIDMTEAIAKSYKFMTENKLALGNK